MRSIWTSLRNHLCIDYAYGLESYLKFLFRVSKYLNFLWFRDKAQTVGKTICERLKDSLPRQLFEIAIQAAIGSKVIARETWVEIPFFSWLILEMIYLENEILKTLTLAKASNFSFIVPSGVNESKLYLFFLSDQQKMYFLVCCRI